MPAPASRPLPDLLRFGPPGAAPVPADGAAVDAGADAATRYRALLEQSPVAVHVFDTGGQTVAVNPAFERLFGITAEQAMRYNIFEDPQPAANGTLDLLRRTFAGEVTRSAPVRHDASRTLGVGRAPWIEVTAYPVRDADGVVREVVLLAEDVTERVEAAQAAAAAVARTDALLAVTGALVEAATPEDVARVVVAHAAAALGAPRGAVALLADGPDGPGTALEVIASTGYSEAAVAAHRRIPLAAAFPLSDVARTGEPLYLPDVAARRARYPHLAHLSDENGGGAMIAVPLVARPVADRGPRVVGALGFNLGPERAVAPEDRALLAALAQQCAQAVERAQLYAAERLLRAEAEAARQRAEEANRVKSQFLANMSHELRTPLNAIAGYVQLLDMGLHGPVTGAQRDALGRVDRAGRHLLGLINDVLNYAKLESGRVEYDVRPVDLADVCAAVTPLVEPQRRAKRLRFELDLPGACRVWADPDKLAQVLVNLLSNAVKFTPEGGVVRLAAAARTSPDGSGAGVAFVRVSDTGIGIPRDRQDAVFEPFVQVRAREGSYAQATEGTGLGLAIARDLARGMGGDLRVRSREGRGSTFTVTLRLAA